MLKLHPCFCKWQNFILFYGWAAFLYMWVCVCEHTISSWSILLLRDTSCFPILVTVNNAAGNIAMRVLFSHQCFWYFRYILRSGISESYSSSIFSFLRNYHTFFLQWLHQFTLLSTMYKGTLFSTSLPIICFCSFWWLPFWQAWGNISLRLWFAFLW